MAGSIYPHVVFAGEEAALDKSAVESLVRETLAAENPQIEDKPLQLVATLGSFRLTIWFDDEADQVSERYVAYLPPTARRRRLLACTTMLDISGSDDSDGSHAGCVTRLAEAMAERPGVFVFDETRKRFIGLDYGDEVVESAPADQAADTTTRPEPAEPDVASSTLEPIPAPAPEPALTVLPQPATAPEHAVSAEPHFAPVPDLEVGPEPEVAPAPETRAAAKPPVAPVPDAEKTPEPEVAFEPDAIPEPDLADASELDAMPVPAAGPEPLIVAAAADVEPEPEPALPQLPEPAQVQPPQSPAFEPVPGPEATAGPAIPVPPQAEPEPGWIAGPEPTEPRPTDDAPERDLVEMPGVAAPAPVPGDHTQPVTGPPPTPAADRAAGLPVEEPADARQPGDVADADVEDGTGRRPGAFRRMLERRRERKRNR